MYRIHAIPEPYGGTVIVVLPEAVLFVVVLAVTRTGRFPETVYVWLVEELDVVTPEPSPKVQA
jgi:hypothetical protein